MLPLLAMAAIGAALGAAKNEFVDKPKEKRQREMQSITTRYSPWTGLRGAEPQESDFLGNTMQGAMTAASMGQNLQAHQQQLDFAEEHPLLAHTQGRYAGDPYRGYYGSSNALAADTLMNQQDALMRQRDPRYPFLGAGG